MLHRSPFQFFFLIGIVFVLCVGHASRSAYADTIEVRIDGYRIQPDESGRYSVVEGTPLDVYFITSDSPRKPQFYQLGDMEGEGGPDEFTYQYHIAITAPYLPGQTLPLTAYDPDTETALDEIITSFTIQPAPQVFDAWDAPALGVRLTLYYIDNNQLKQIWLSPTKRQKNPQRTGFNGKYQFYVEPGRYLLDAEAVGFENTSTEITMTERGYITQSIQLAYVADKDIKNIAVDPSVMGLIDALLERLKLLSKDEDVIELTNKLLKPASWLIMISAIFMYIFSLLMQLGVSLATLPNLGVHGLQFLVQLFNGKSNKKKWGKVYEHFTHDPIPLAAVMLFHEPDHKLDQMTLTEIDGTYGFPEIEGSYSLFVSKKGFKFPPAATKHVYKGEVFKTMKGTLPKMNIAVDYDLEAEKANAGFLMAQKMFSGGHLFLSLIGFGLSLWTLIVKFSIASFALLLLYVWLISSRITTILTNSRVHQTVHQVKLGKKDEKAPPAHKSI